MQLVRRLVCSAMLWEIWKELCNNKNGGKHVFPEHIYAYKGVDSGLRFVDYGC